MIKKYSLVLVVLLCSFFYGFGQIITFEFNGLAGSEVSANSNFNDANLSASTITRGSGLTASNNGNRFNATSWATANILNAVSGNDYMEFTVSPNGGFQFDVSTIVLNFQRSGTGPRGLALRSSLDSFATNIDGEKVIVDNGSTQIITFNVGQANSAASVTYRIYGWAEATGGSGGIGDGAGNDLIVNGTVTPTCTDTVDFQNIQSPTASPQTITVGDVFNVYAQVYEPTVTEAAGAGAGIEAWIGYNTTNDNPNNNVGWTWIPATFNTQAGNNDEFTAEIGSGLATGTYYYASRFRLNSCGFTYGGIGGNWNNDSVQLIVNPDQVDFCNVDFPKTGNITTGDNFSVYAQAYEPGVTDAAGQGANILAWIGYNTIGINYQPWNTTGWTWVAAIYDSDSGNNDQYVAEIGSGLPAGTYYYASRFQLNGSDFSYGGIQFDNIGNFWDTTNNNGTLTITNPPLADVVITEIMYNPPGANDYEWIEICNLNGTAQDVSNYTIDVNGTTRFTFPASTTIPANSCITVLLGHLVTSPAPECPFTPDYSNPIGNTNVLFNGGATIELVASFGTTADIVAYDDADSNATDGNGSSFHVIDATLNNADTATNWQAVADGGSPGTNTLVSPCSAPELQLVNSSNVDQTCGAFTLDFGSQATGFNTDLTFDIDNDGTLDLTISSLTFSGGNPGDFSIVSPAATPFTITSGNTQTVTVRFTPSALGNRTTTLTINNNDADEGTCAIALQGIGTTPAPEINVEGDTGSFPDIANGSTATSFLNNTRFSDQFIGSSQAKSFRIQNLGTADLTGLIVTIGGANPADFTVSIAPAAAVTPSNLTTFEITFAPLTPGVNKTADISIANNDSDENPYTFRVQGTGLCVANAITITPTSGPEGTVVTVTGTNLSTATASFNGLAASVTNISATEMEVIVPAGATTGNLEVTDDLGCPGSAPFAVIDTQISTCEGGTALTELFISEVTDATYGGLTYIELYNPTSGDINLSNYSIDIYINGNTDSLDTGKYKTQTLSGTILANQTFVISTGYSGIFNCDSQPGGNASYSDFDSITLGGINKKDNEHDYIGLYKSGTGLVDAFGVFGDNVWMDTLHTTVTGDRGFNFRRLNTATPLPQTVFDDNDWTIIDWVGSGSGSCSTNDYSDIGIYDFSTGTPPSVTLQPSAPSSTCDLSATLTVAGSEGFAGGFGLAYQWYFSAPGDTGWTAITNGALYNGATTATLNILNTISLNNYQYYCQVRENSATCYQASNAIKLTVQTTEWDGTSWSNGVPNINNITVINGDYNTSVGGVQDSFSACQLIVNATYTLTISNSTFVEVENDVTVNGNILVTTQGAFVQNNDSGSVSVTGNITVEKLTAPINNWYEYAYWSSPVSGETIGNGLAEAHPNRRFWFNAANYRDSTMETNNDNGTVVGQDDIDDNANDWTFTNNSDIMTPGVGYAATHDPIGFITPGLQYKYTFVGPFNNGIINSPVVGNDAETLDSDWNFIGNPYPSAINADSFFTTNIYSGGNTSGTIEGSIYLWSQNTAPSGTTNGNENLNFSQSDYAVINGASQTAGGDLVMPSRFIPSGQGFFVIYADARPSNSGNVVFNNAMRMANTTSNNQFFRSSNDIVEDNKLWLNLTSDNGVFNQVSIAYVEGATNNYDGEYYDAPRNLSSGAYSILYSIIEDSDKKFAIQGKDPNSLNLDEIIPLGFYTSIDEATLYTFSIEQLEGDFLTNNTIYLKDNAMNVIHNLSDSDYTFTSDVGEFNERFEIVFNRETLSVGENELNPNDLTIVELNDAEVRFTVSNNFQIKSVEIIDLLGRTIYRLQGTSSSETYNLSNLSKSAYIAKVELSNGQIITKKAIKRH